ncbi:cysteine-rich CWC family protein [Janthinobacterium agaricidamnosum]|uniref:cysteine-rich CWC family protein n=1 Tax=Janthinobacterium agaricidamnosum TaxID=55508 RepID=UPI0009DDFC36|nr:cysteine-rich CWC family protein [Janthinobacterium agaricidamnosum]
MSLCSRCGAPFSCGVVEPADVASPAECWCMALPRLAAPPAASTATLGGACWCAACLRLFRAYPSR